MCFINLEILIQLYISATEDVPMSHKNRAFQFPRIHMLARRLEIPHSKVSPLDPPVYLPHRRTAM